MAGILWAATTVHGVNSQDTHQCNNIGPWGRVEGTRLLSVGQSGLWPYLYVVIFHKKNAVMHYSYN